MSRHHLQLLLARSCMHLRTLGFRCDADPIQFLYITHVTPRLLCAFPPERGFTVTKLMQVGEGLREPVVGERLGLGPRSDVGGVGRPVLRWP